MLALRRLAVAKPFGSVRNASAFVAKFDASIEALPMREVARYAKKDMRWTAGDFKHFADAHANALLDINVQKGDTIVLWMPESAEKHVAMVAAAKAGLKIVDVNLKITDIADIRAFLTAAQCKVIYFKPEHDEHDYLLLLRKAIPEFFEWDDSRGQMFHSKHFRHMRYFVQTSGDVENGCLNFKQLFLPNPSEDLLAKAAARIADSDVLYQQVTKGASGIQVGEAHTAATVLDLPAWAFAKKIVNNQHFEL